MNAQQIEAVSKVERDDILLKAEDESVYVVRFSGASAAPRLLRLDDVARAEDSVKRTFDAGMLLAVPRRDADTIDGTFRLDMSLAKDNVPALSGASFSAGSSTAGDPAAAGPYDVVFGRRGDDKRQVFVVQCTDYSASGEAVPCAPKAVVEARDPASVEAVQSLFDTGVMLAYLQELTLPIGFTCYLLNTEKFWK